MIFNNNYDWSEVLSSPSRVLIIRFFTYSPSRAVSPSRPPNFHLRLTGPRVLPVCNPTPHTFATTHFSSPLFPATSNSPISTARTRCTHIRHSRRAIPDARNFPTTLWDSRHVALVAEDAEKGDSLVVPGQEVRVWTRFERNQEGAFVSGPCTLS